MTIGVVCNLHAEKFALKGFSECMEKTFDSITFVSSPPEGVAHCEESIEIIRKTGCRLIFDTVSQGFGALRTRCIGYSKEDWTLIADADERVMAEYPSWIPSGEDFYPEQAHPKVSIAQNGAPRDARALLRGLCSQADSEGALAVCLSRRHWLNSPEDFLKNPQPAQSWLSRPDWQLRLVKNSPFAFYDPEVRIHERLLDSRTWSEPKYIRSQSTESGPFLEHFSIFYKAKDAEKNKQDAKTYESLEEGSVSKMWLGTFEGVKS